ARTMPTRRPTHIREPPHRDPGPAKAGRHNRVVLCYFFPDFSGPSVTVARKEFAMARPALTPRFWKIGLLAVVAVTALLMFAARLRAADATPTFTKDVAPLFQAKCEACHRPDSMAPMSLQTYQDVRPWARSIKARVTARQMPPWHIDKNVGIQEFKNDRSLSD